MRNIKINHVVERYLDTCRAFEKKTGFALQYDEKGLDFFISEKERQETGKLSQDFPLEKAFTVVLGATHQTKKWLPEYFIQLLNQLNLPVLLIGGKTEVAESETITQKLTCPFYNAVGKFSLLSSAAQMAKTRFVLTHDTGFMHIAAAFQMKIFSLWGSTSPDLGFAPYKTENTSLIIKDLACQPCSKIGLAKCPEGHFRCMKELKPDIVIQKIIL